MTARARFLLMAAILSGVVFYGTLAAIKNGVKMEDVR